MSVVAAVISVVASVVAAVISVIILLLLLYFVLMFVLADSICCHYYSVTFHPHLVTSRGGSPTIPSPLALALALATSWP